MGALLWAGEEALVSHRAAARLWRFETFDESPIEISARRARAPTGVVLHRPADEPGRRHVDGFRVTNVERTLLDLSALVPSGVLGRALDESLIRRLTTPARLCRALDLHGGQGRPGTATFRRLLDLRFPAEEGTESHLELRLLRLIRRSRLPLPTPQFEVSARGRFVARLDFAYPELKLGIETHGYRWHGGYERWRADVRRENRLKRMGWVILVFTWDDVVGDASRVVAEITEAFVERSEEGMRVG